MNNFSWKWLILIALTSWSLVVVYPPSEKINLGLDLRGGSSFTLVVETADLKDEAVRDIRSRAMEIIRNRVEGPYGGLEPIIYPELDNRIVVQIPGLESGQRQRVVDILMRQAFLEFRLVHEENDRLVRELFARGRVPPGYRIVTLADSRQNERGAQREYFRRVDTEETMTPDEEEEWRSEVRNFHAPPGTELLMMEEEVGGRRAYTPIYVQRRVQLTGDHITRARVDVTEVGRPYVAINLDGRGADRFATVTGANVGRQLAIVLDGVVRSAPVIQTEITGGRASITGRFSREEANDLVIVLEAGSLPTPVRLEQERSVDPTLGADSIRRGTWAIIIGGFAVVIFMFAYYMWAGVVANIALLLDLLLLPLGMVVVSGFMGLITGAAAGGGGSAIGLPVLTLPGVAGIVLTIGMAVDANVLIFERIREEQRSGKRFTAAVASGYEKAFSTIFDANITTLLTALILFWQGSGPVRGFAITLSAGIVVSLYTALVVTRMLFNLMGRHSSIKKLKMRSIIGDTNIDFLSKSRIALIGSALLIAVAWSVFFGRGYQQNLGIDFVGGSSLVFEFDTKQGVAAVRDSLQAAGVSDPVIQYQRETAPAKEVLVVRVTDEDSRAALSAILENFGDAGYRDVRIDTVGEAVGRELRNRGLTALLFAMIGIVIYISFRFEFAFAIGAIVAVLHDVLITVGIFCLLGRQLNLPIIAALLTIVGYSVNDTIVVFDRIREDLRLMKDKSYKDICNISINQTLSRTLLTSLTTLLTVTILLLIGGGGIRDFALTLFIGIISGTYSSIFIASPVVLLWHREQQKNSFKQKKKAKTIAVEA